MNLKLGEIRGMERGLAQLMQLQLPIKLSFRLAKLANRCRKELLAVEQERVKLVKKYSDEPDEKGENKVKEENEQKFREEFAQLLDEEVELEVDPIYISDFGDIKVPPSSLFWLEKVIIEK